MRILNAEPRGYSREAHGLLLTVGEVIEREVSRPELLSLLGDVEVLIVRLAHQVDREVIDAAPRLKVIVTATTGTDHIDLDAARVRGVTVLSLRGETTFLETIHATAEHTWALLLSLVRRIPWAAWATGEGSWTRDAFRGHELHGKALGLVGVGRVGGQVAAFGRAFGMTVLAFDPAVSTVTGVKVVDLPELLERSDVVSLHLPLSEDTRGMFTAREFALMQGRPFFLNTSRAEIVEEAALVDALLSGQLSGAALDVLAAERDDQRRADNPLLGYAKTHDNLLITPHIAGATAESMARTEVFMATKLIDLVRSDLSD